MDSVLACSFVTEQESRILGVRIQFSLLWSIFLVKKLNAHIFWGTKLKRDWERSGSNQSHDQCMNFETHFLVERKEKGQEGKFWRIIWRRIIRGKIIRGKIIRGRRTKCWCSLHLFWSIIQKIELFRLFLLFTDWHSIGFAGGGMEARECTIGQGERRALLGDSAITEVLLAQFRCLADNSTVTVGG